MQSSLDGLNTHPTVFLPLLYLFFPISTDANFVQALDDCALDYDDNNASSRLPSLP